MAKTEPSVREAEDGRPATGLSTGWLVWAGPAALAVALGAYAINVWLHPHIVVSDVDLAVYRDAGLLVRRSPDLLYRWQESPGVRFTYTPFAAALCAGLSVLPWWLLARMMLAGGVAALLQTVWLAMGALGWRGRSRFGAACAVAAVAIWIEPVQRTLNTGEVDLLLMLLVVADLTHRPSRWQGAGLGLAIGIKLVALIFIPYLLVTGRFRQAAVAAGTFGATVAAGALLLPRASAAWWFGGAFLSPGRTGFPGYLPNQSLLGMITRLAGVEFPAAGWLVFAVLTGGLGVMLAAAVYRQGWPVQGLALCAVTGLVASPVSWDHHWVWIALVLAVLADLAARARGAVRAAWAAAACLVAALFLAWPSIWEPSRPWGLIWYAPATPHDLGSYHPEYHWAGLQLLAGNLYLLAGLVILAAAAIATLIGPVARRDRHAGRILR